MHRMNAPWARRALLLIAVGATPALATQPAPKVTTPWREVTDVMADCETDSIKPISFKEVGRHEPGTRLLAADFAPDAYTTGDMTASCKLMAVDTQSEILAFESAPLSWNSKEKAFEAPEVNGYLVRIVGGMPYMTQVHVYRKVAAAAKLPATTTPASSSGKPAVSTPAGGTDRNKGK